MAGEYPFINGPGSGWHDTSPGSGTVRRQINANTRGKLLQEAGTLVPDSAKLAEEMLKYKISGGDRKQFTGQLNGMLNKYLTSYNENPYYAFSREGKEMTKEMQRLINDPIFTQLEENYKRSQDAYEKAGTENLLNKINVVDGQISVFDTKDKSFKLVNPDLIDNDRYRPLTVDQMITGQSQRGFYNPNGHEADRAMPITMASDKEVVEMINNMLQGTGSTANDNTLQKLQGDVSKIQDLVTTKYKSNASQLNSKMKAILSEAGLAGSYWDTLKSNAYSRLRTEQGFPTEAQANQAAVEYLGNLVYGRLDTAIDHSTSSVATAKRALTEGSGKSVNHGFYSSVVAGEVGSNIDNETVKQGQPQKSGKGLGDNFWENYVDQNGINAGLVPLSQNKVFKSFVPPGKQVETVYGNSTIPLSSAIPAADSKTFMSYGRNGEPGELVFDVYVDKSELEDEDNVKYTSLTKEDENHIERLSKSLMESREKKGSMYSFDSWEEANVGFIAAFKTDNFVRVRVKVPYSAEQAQTMGRTFLDRDPMNAPESATTFGGSAPAPQSNPQRPQYE